MANNPTGALLALVLLVLFGCEAGTDEQSPPAFAPRFEPLTEGASFPVAVPTGFRSERGFLLVPENRSDPKSRILRLPVAIIRAKSGSSKMAPVVFLPGGPGVRGMSAAAYPGAYPWTADRDFIVYGRRGAEAPDGPLDCPEYEAALRDSEEVSDYAIGATECRERLVREGVDLSRYHSAAHAADLEALREALGYERLSLFALSYGTRIALTYARDFPAHVEALVLDSPLPHAADFDASYPENLRAALSRTAELCAAGDACAQAYPDLSARFFASIADAERTPWIAADGREVSAAALVSVVSPSSAQAPFRMDAIARRDEEALSDVITAPMQLTDFVRGLRLSVWCSEAAPFSARADGFDPSSTFAGFDGAVFQPEVCAAWDVPSRPSGERAATISSVPALIIAGELDPLTPPKWGALAAETLSNSKVVTISAGGHGETVKWDGDGCAMSLAADFFANPEVALSAPTPTCVEARAPDFFVPDNGARKLP